MRGAWRTDLQQASTCAHSCPLPRPSAPAQVDQILAMRRDLTELVEKSRRLEGEKEALETDIASLRTQVRGGREGCARGQGLLAQGRQHASCAGSAQPPARASVGAETPTGTALAAFSNHAASRVRAADRGQEGGDRAGDTQARAPGEGGARGGRQLVGGRAGLQPSLAAHCDLLKPCSRLLGSARPTLRAWPARGTCDAPPPLGLGPPPGARPQGQPGGAQQ